VGKDFELIRQFNPLGRVPALVLADGESLIDSTAILDFLDDSVGPERALLPSTGKERRDAMRILALALGAAEKGLHQLFELVFKPAAKRHDPWMERCRHQMHGALSELDRLAQTRPGQWFLGDRLTQADITATCVYTYLCDALRLNESFRIYPGLSALAAHCEALPAFAQSRLKFDAPTPYADPQPSREDALH
jgi:glutathione S-transferase